MVILFSPFAVVSRQTAEDRDKAIPGGSRVQTTRGCRSRTSGRLHSAPQPGSPRRIRKPPQAGWGCRRRSGRCRKGPPPEEGCSCPGLGSATNVKLVQVLPSSESKTLEVPRNAKRGKRCFHSTRRSPRGGKALP